MLSASPCRMFQTKDSFNHVMSKSAHIWPVFSHPCFWGKPPMWRWLTERALRGYEDTVCYFDLPSRLQNGPVINLERSLKADELIRTATQLRSLPLFIRPISPFMSWDPQLSATLVSIDLLGAFSFIWCRWTRSCRFVVGPRPRFKKCH